MRIPRFRIIDLLAAVAACALIFAVGGSESSRTSPITFVAPLAYTGVLGWLVATAIASRFGSPRRRPARWGASVVAGLYLLLTVADAHPGPIGEGLLTSHLVSRISDPMTRLIQGQPSQGVTFLMLG